MRNFRLVLAVLLVGAAIYQFMAGRWLIGAAAAVMAVVMAVIALAASKPREPAAIEPAEPPRERRRMLRPASELPPEEDAAPVEPLSFEALRAEHARPALALVRPYPPTGLPALRSHIGGLPSLPPGMTWPRADDDSGCMPANTPLHFLAQIDLGEQAWLPNPFPRKGTLMFFGALPDGYYWTTANDSRVLYDPDSIGQPTQPPADLAALEHGFGEYDKHFGTDDWLRLRTFPHWPLVGRQIESMPQGDAIAPDWYSNPRFANYDAELKAFRAEQAANAAGIDLARFAEPIPETAEVIADGAFPWVARGIGLMVRAMRQSYPDAPDDLSGLADQWRDWADGQPPHFALPDEAVREFALLTEHWPWQANQSLALLAKRTIDELVRQSGADPELAAALPAGVHALVWRDHAPVEPEWSLPKATTDPAKMLVRMHQLGGHVPSTQGAVPLDYDRICLFQLQTDTGIDVTMCDMGEADFWIRPAALARADFSDVEGDTRGG